MQTLFKSIVLILTIFFLTSCTNEQKVKFWNGYYSDQAAVRDFDKKKEAYYASKSPEWMVSFKANKLECEEITNKMPGKYYEQRIARSETYINCMEERGTPVYI